jgi:hypothetical protein
MQKDDKSKLRFRIATAFVFVLVAVGCAAKHQSTCSTHETQSISDLLYFGTAKAAGFVTPSEWSDFLMKTVTPRFPQGFTVWQASGQWQDNKGNIVQETSYVLNLIHTDDERSENAINTLTLEYKSRFKQDAVLRIKSVACLSY